MVKVSKKNGEAIVFREGQLGSAFNLEDLHQCVVYAFDKSSQGYIDDCVDTTIYLGPIHGALCVRDCKNCTIYALCSQFRIRSCENCVCFLFVSTQPALESSKGLVFKPYNVAFPGLPKLVNPSMDLSKPNRYNVPSDFSAQGPSGERCQWTVINPADVGDMVEIDIEEEDGKRENAEKIAGLWNVLPIMPCRKIIITPKGNIVTPRSTPTTSPQVSPADKKQKKLATPIRGSDLSGALHNSLSKTDEEGTSTTTTATSANVVAGTQQQQQQPKNGEEAEDKAADNDDVETFQVEGLVIVKARYLLVETDRGHVYIAPSVKTQRIKKGTKLDCTVYNSDRGLRAKKFNVLEEPEKGKEKNGAVVGVSPGTGTGTGNAPKTTTTSSKKEKKKATAAQRQDATNIDKVTTRGGSPVAGTVHPVGAHMEGGGQVVIRHYVDGDHPKLTKFLEEATMYIETLDDRSTLQKQIEFDPTSIIIAEVGEHLLGTVYVLYNPWQSFVYHLCVHPSHRDKGIANMLMDQAEQQLKDRGCRCPTLFVEAGNEAVSTFYERRGWFATDHVCVMGKDL